MPVICSRLGRFSERRYFSMASPNCFCAPAATPPARFIACENSGVSMALLAKELNPFSISPIIFCHVATGSLVLSVIGVLRMSRAAMPFFFRHTTLLRGAGQPASSGCGVARAASLRRETVRYSINQQQGNAAVIAHQPPQTVHA